MWENQGEAANTYGDRLDGAEDREQWVGDIVKRISKARYRVVKNEVYRNDETK